MKKLVHVVLIASLFAIAACSSKEETHEEPEAAENHTDLPMDPTASQDAEAAIAAAMAASPTALEAPSQSSQAGASPAASPPVEVHAPAADHAKGH